MCLLCLTCSVNLGVRVGPQGDVQLSLEYTNTWVALVLPAFVSGSRHFTVVSGERVGGRELQFGSLLILSILFSNSTSNKKLDILYQHFKGRITEVKGAKSQAWVSGSSTSASFNQRIKFLTEFTQTPLPSCSSGSWDLAHSSKASSDTTSES